MYSVLFTSYFLKLILHYLILCNSFLYYIVFVSTVLYYMLFWFGLFYYLVLYHIIYCNYLSKEVEGEKLPCYGLLECQRNS